MSDDITTILFRRLNQYVVDGLITKGQLAEIHRHELNRLQVTPEQRAANYKERLMRDYQRALENAKGSRKRAAWLLGISERTLYRNMKRFNIEQ